MRIFHVTGRGVVPTGGRRCAGGRRGEVLSGEQADLIEQLGEPRVDGAEMIVVVMAPLLEIPELTLVVLALTLVLLHLAKNGVFLEALHQDSVSSDIQWIQE